MDNDKYLKLLIKYAMQQSLANIRCERPLIITDEQIKQIMEEVFIEMKNITSKSK